MRSVSQAVLWDRREQRTMSISVPPAHRFPGDDDDDGKSDKSDKSKKSKKSEKG